MEWLYWIVGLLPYAVAALLGLAVPLLVLGAYNSLGFGLVLIGATFLLDGLNLSQPILRLGLTLYPPDLPLVLIGVAAAARWMLKDEVPRRHAAWVVLVLVFFANVAMGLVRHGTAAGVQARADYYAIAVASYAMSFPITLPLVQRLLRMLLALAIALLLVCAWRWTVYYTPIPELLPPGGVYNPDGAIRVVGSNFALVVAEALVVGAFFARAGLGPRSAVLALPLLFGVVVVLQHRSVWLATLAGIALSLLVARSQRVPVWQQLLLLAAIGAISAAPLLFSRGLSDQVSDSAAHAIAGEGTVNARFENWRATIRQWSDDGPRAVLLGRLPGSDARRIVETESGELRRITFGAHNQYVTILTTQGIVGALAFVAIVGNVLLGLWRVRRRRDDDAPVAALLLVLVGMQLVYYVAYAVDFIQFLVLGMALAWVAGRTRTAVPSQVRPADASGRRTAGA